MKKNMKIIIILLVIAAAATAGWIIWQQLNRETPVSQLYPVENAAYTDVTQTVPATGHVGALETVPLYLSRAQTAGQIAVKEGDFVNTGDVLVVWDIEQDRADLERKLAQARLNLENARLGLSLIGQPAQGNERVQYESDVTAAEKGVFDAENEIRSTQLRITQQERKLDDARKTLERHADLLDAGALTQTEYDYSETTFNNAQEALDDLMLQLSIKERTLTLKQTQLSDAKQRLQNALNRLAEESNTLKYNQQENVILLNELELAQLEDDLARLVPETVSPVTGYVENVYILEGAAAAKGSLLMELADLSQTIVRADITEYDAPLLAVGQPVNITTSGLPDVEYTGEISKIAAGAVEKEKSSGTERAVPVEITLRDADDALKTGYSVDLEIFIAMREQVLSVPVQSVETSGEQQFVYILRDDLLEKRVVETGLRGDKRIEIIAGVSEGEAVVISHAEIETRHKEATSE